MGDKEHHVHFSGAGSLGRDNDIMIQPQRHGHVDVHLGFLQRYHRYHVEFSLPWNTCDHGELAPAIIASLYNPECYIIDLTQEKDGLKLKISLVAYKEKILKEEIEIMCCKSGAPLKILLIARVISRNKGKPFLKNGVSYVEFEKKDIDECSD